VFYSNIHFRRVFRIHQFPGKSVRVQYKEDIALKEATKTLIKQTCEDVRKFLELDFCAINIGWDEERFFILNVNTAPELDEDLARVYAKHIKELV
jgi:glutathione synthase/RimK-type ligase-like ATP-grasp enzyme